MKKKMVTRPKTLRGGAWFNSAVGVRCAYRLPWHLDYWYGYGGFRVVVYPRRVLRGGAFDITQRRAHCIWRSDFGYPDRRSDNVSFRVVLFDRFSFSVVSQGEKMNKLQTLLKQVEEIAAQLHEMQERDQDAIIDMELVEIPAGPFKCGDDCEIRETDAYLISKYPVTNAQYKKFVDSTGHEAPRHWTDGEIPDGKKNHPVVYVSFYDAQAYCKWLSGELGEEVQLPSELQWEKAARGTDGRKYPWGDEFDQSRVNCNHVYGDTTPVNQFPEGASPYGVFDMAGNVWEWTRDEYK